MKCNHNKCKKKILQTDAIIGQCKCDNVYCIVHRLPENHQCQFDWKKQGISILEKTLIACKNTSLKIVLN